MINTLKIGIIGYGYLGESICSKLLVKGFSRENIRITTSGSLESREKIKINGLEKNITTNEKITYETDVTLIALRPNQADILKSIRFNDDCVLVSLMAGLTTTSLGKMLNHKIVKLIPSNPATIDNDQAICATYPAEKVITDVVQLLGITQFILEEEKHFQIFTALVCLPAAFLELHKKGIEIKSNDNFGFKDYTEIFDWARSVTPLNLSPSEEDTFITRMATKGGITEAIINSIRNGANLEEAINVGINRSIYFEKSLT